MKTLEEMDQLFGAQVSNHERDITARIRHELGLSLSQDYETSQEA